MMNLDIFTALLKEITVALTFSHIIQIQMRYTIDLKQQFEHDILNALDRYNKFITDLEPYPEWKKKVE